MLRVSGGAGLIESGSGRAGGRDRLSCLSDAPDVLRSRERSDIVFDLAITAPAKTRERTDRFLDIDPWQIAKDSPRMRRRAQAQCDAAQSRDEIGP